MQAEMKNPLITVITASFNSAQTIAETIESVYIQSCSDFQYIIVDGGSTDGTVEIIQSFKCKFQDRLIWISEKDEGIYDAWNKGVKLAQGEWVCFLGSDDVLLPDALDNYKKAIIKNPTINFISSKVELVNTKMEYLTTFGLPWSSKMKRYCCIAHVGSLHKISLFQKYGLFSLKYKICGDYDFLMRVYKYITPTYINVVTAKMRNVGVSNSIPYLAFKETYLIKNANGINFTLYNYIYYLKTIWGYWIKKYILRIK